MAFDVFISYSGKDKTTAHAACAALETAGIRCWIAPRDIRPGTEYAAGIIEGIDSCRIMVLIFSAYANASPQIHREIERGVSKGLPIIPFRIEEIAPTKAMEYYLGSIHWLDALTPPLAKHIAQLVEQVKANLQVGAADGAPPTGAFETIAPQGASSADYRNRPNRLQRSAITGHAVQLALAVSVTLAVVIVLVWNFLPRRPPVQNNPVAAAPPLAVPLPERPVPVPNPGFVIRRSAAFGGDGGAGFDDLSWNTNQLQISGLNIMVNLNPADTAQRIIGGLQEQWGDQSGPLHGGKGPFAQPATVIRFDPDEKIGRVDVNTRSYHFPGANPPPQWIAGLKVWTDTRVYTFGDMTFGPTNQCILAAGEVLLGFFGRSGSYIDQIGCIIGAAK
jgi:TIR domain-containing protein/jacalin-like lectin domain-containing protein